MNILVGMLIAYLVISWVYIITSTVADKYVEDIMGWLLGWYVILIGCGVGFVAKFFIEKKKAYKKRRFQALQKQLRGLYGDKIENLSDYFTLEGCRILLKNPVFVANELYKIK